MAQKSQGIQQLLAAEKKAADLISDARKRKTKRLKQAKEEAIQEIELYRNEREAMFKAKQTNQVGEEDFTKRINEDTDNKLLSLDEDVKINKDKVIERMLELVYNIEPELHENFRI